MPQPIGRRVWVPFASIGLAATAGYLLAPRGSLAQVVLFVALQAAALAALVFRVHRYRPMDPATWRLLIAAEVVYLVANTTWYVYPVATANSWSYPSFLDVLFIGAYLTWAVFIGRLVWRQGVGDRGATLDALVVGAALALAAWELLLEPAIVSPGVSRAARTAAVVYSVTLLLLACMAVRLILVAQVRTAAHVLVGTWITLELVADVSYSLTSAKGTFEYGSPWFAAWMLSYTALGSLALHPDMSVLTRSSQARAGGGAMRLVVLWLAVCAALFVVGNRVGAPEHVSETRILLGLVAVIASLIIVRLAVDIVERRRAENQATDRAATLEAVFSASPDPIVVLAEDATVREVSPAAVALVGRPADEMRGRPVLDLVHADDRERVANALSAMLHGGSAEGTVRHRLDGSRDGLVMDSSATAMLRNDAPFGAVVVSRDVSTLVAGEEELRAAKEEAEEANKAKTEFLSRMSHELRTPLNAVLGFAQLLARDELDDDQRDSVEHIRRAGRHLLVLIDDVLDIARAESGRFSISLESVSVCDTARRTVELMSAMARERNVNVVVEERPDAYVLADAQRLAQVLINLVGNGVKYNRDGGTVTVRWERDDDASVRIDVSDDGRGIAAALLPRLFTPFDRLGAEATGIEGTGVGLALSRRLVEAMGGTLEVASREGEGSTFTVRLAATSDPVEPAAFREEGPATVASTATPATVLYVEDNIANLRLVERVLRARPNIELVPIMQGRFAVELARHNPPSLILLDQHLPDIPAIEVLAALRADERTASIPVVVLSADARPSSIQHLRDAGVADYLTKPLDVERLLVVVDEQLEGEGGEDDRAAGPARPGG